MKKIAAVILSLVLLMTASTALATVNASYSYASISENSTGAWGDDVEFSGRTPITGKNYSNATNNLYVAAQKEGDKNFGGTISTHLVAPGTSLDVTVTIDESAHVLLDPSGPWATGCDGSQSDFVET